MKASSLQMTEFTGTSLGSKWALRHAREQKKWSQSISSGVRMKDSKAFVVSWRLYWIFKFQGPSTLDWPTLLTLASAGRAPECIPATLHPVWGEIS